MSLRSDINSALSIIGALKRQLADGAVGGYTTSSLTALIASIESAKRVDTNQDNAPVYAKLIDTAQRAREDARSGNTEVVNMTENVNKIEEYVKEIARRANVGGRRRKTRKGKKRATRRR